MPALRSNAAMPARDETGRDFMRRVRRLHFVGIGGAGMSGIAEVLLNLGYEVTGSDLHETPVTRRLTERGARIWQGHDKDHVTGADVVVASGAVPADNPELIAARDRRLPVVPRAEMLGELMRFRRGIAIAGTHGKTTTTSLVASLLGEAGLDPTFVIGGRLNSAGGGARLGAGEYLVAEADESDGSFLMLSPVIAIVTNIDADHLNAYGGDFQNLTQAFADFLQRLPFYGLAVLGIDDPVVARLAPAVTRQLITYGMSEDADVRAKAIKAKERHMTFDLHLPGRAPLPVELRLPGRHNVLNALAASAVAFELGAEPEVIQRGLKEFAGIGRRFEVSEIRSGSAAVLLVDDYGHHPREITATLAAARAGWPDRRTVLVFQPHRYSRTQNLFDDFVASLSQADVLVLIDVYSAGEAPIAGADGRALARAIRARGQLEPIFVHKADDLPEVLPRLVQAGDLLILQGAGDIGQVAAQLARSGLP